MERIHQLLEIEGSTVTWNDHIPDPDNPSRPRQIDVSIRRDGSLTLVECRIHKDPQDVTWVEELMGRRTSYLDDVRKRPLKRLGPWATFVACHRFIGRSSLRALTCWSF